ncbi:MAG: hypothetical protein H6732_01545 [Alphaproteobacteria bacterium]|nr:hypothetical protein [Alphaproteobacteria bacterium]
MTTVLSARDVGLVARFELLRALRTWRALALLVVHLVAHVGVAYVFIEALAAVETGLAEQLGVPATRWPGPLLDEVRRSEQIRDLVGGFAGDPALVDALLGWPLLAVLELWFGLVLGPFLAATAAAETIALDVRSRAIRYEALRTGRTELVVGRWVGQVALLAVAQGVALLGVWTLGMLLMVGQSPVALGAGLAVLGGRALLLSLPFAALGIACSCWTASAAWARVLALSAAAGSWVLYGILRLAEDPPWTWLSDALVPLLPQAWSHGLWTGGGELALSSAVLVCLSLLGLGVATLGLVRRDL